MSISRDRLAASAAALGLALDNAQLSLFARYADLLIEGSRALNLTTVIEPQAIEEKHLLDSLSVLAVLPPETRRLIDVGSGAGLPGIPLKIARPQLEVTLLEATGKKVAWLNATVQHLELDGIEALAERAETLGHDARHRERYDVSLARAVASLPALCELCLPFVRVGGRFVAQKSASGAAEEVSAAARAIELVGGLVREVLPTTHIALQNRALVVVDKVRETPAVYPRRPGMPTKRPL